MNGSGEKKAYFHIGPKFGTISRAAVNEAIKECRTRGDANWLVILGFSFESDIQGSEQTMSLGSFTVTKARIHDDLLQEGLKKKPSKAAASFVTIGEPDVKPQRDGNTVTLEIEGLDIYDPIKDEVKARDLHDIAYWMVDDDYDGSNFVVKQVFFCGGDKDEFEDWKKGLSKLALQTTKARAEKTLKIEIDDEAFERIYGFRSHPIQITHNGQKLAVRLLSQFGEESMRVFTFQSLVEREERMRREERAQQIWSVLALAATNRQILTYDIVAKLTGVVRPSIGDFLRPIQQFCAENRLPALTSLVVSGETGIPGEGFIAAEDVPAAQIRVFEHDWLERPTPTVEQLADSYSRAPDRRGPAIETTGRGELLPIKLVPPDADEFRQQFLRSHLAEIAVTYRDGRVERKKWRALNFTPSSNVIGNLRSRPHFRSGQWQRKGIREVTVRVLNDQ
jgi:hypothetical protein